MLPLTLLTLVEMAEDRENFFETAKARQNFTQSITAHGIKSLVRAMKAACRPVLCSLHFSMNLPQHEDHVCRPSVGPERTLTFWRVFLCCRWNESVQDASQDFVCNGE